MAGTPPEQSINEMLMGTYGNVVMVFTAITIVQIALALLVPFYNPKFRFTHQELRYRIALLGFAIGLLADAVTWKFFISPSQFLHDVHRLSASAAVIHSLCVGIAFFSPVIMVLIGIGIYIRPAHYAHYLDDVPVTTEEARRIRRESSIYEIFSEV